MDKFLLDQELYFDLYTQAWEYDEKDKYEKATGCNNCWGRGKLRPPLDTLILPLACKKAIAELEETVCNIPLMPGKKSRVEVSFQKNIVCTN